MKTVIIVGAGATLAEALPGNPPRAKIPPLDTTFFDLCKRADLDGRGTLTKYFKSHYGTDPFTAPHRMEEVFNVVYADAMSANPPTNCRAAYWNLMKMYRKSIQTTTNQLNGHSRSGVGALLRFLLSTNPSRKFHFVTFNQDLVIENAIQETTELKSYPKLPWDIRVAYGTEFRAFMKVIRRKPEFSIPDRGHLNSTQVFKLHGSLNWVYKVRSADDAMNSIRTPTGNLYCLLDRDIYEKLRTTGQRRAMPLLPLVVPPVYEKSSHIGKTLKHVWAGARNALETSDEIIVFGYSFPDADLAALNLMRRTFFKNKKISHLHVIDIDPQLSSRVGALVNAPVITQYRGVQDFVREYVARS